MKAALLFCVTLFAAAAQAQTIIAVSERDGHSIKLGDAPCPVDRNKLVARFDSTQPDASTAQGCWGTAGESVVFLWDRSALKVAVPTVLPASDFTGRKP